MPVIVPLIISALNFAMGFIFRSVVVKFVFYFALYFIATESIGYLTNAHIFPNSQSITSMLSSFSPFVWWGLDTIAFDVGFPMILGAYTTRFIIRFLRGM